MAAILDRCLPSRRQERKRLLAMQNDLDSRFGDAHITSPSEGAWHQRTSEDHRHPMSVDRTRSLTPDSTLESYRSDSQGSRASVAESSCSSSHPNRNNFTITIPLPWSSRKSHSRTHSGTLSLQSTTTTNTTQPPSKPRAHPRGDLSPASIASPLSTPGSFFPSPDPSLASTNTSVSVSQSTSPISYKPISGEYRAQLSEMGRHPQHLNTTAAATTTNPAAFNRSQNASPVDAIYRPATGGFLQEMAGVRTMPVPFPGPDRERNLKTSSATFSVGKEEREREKERERERDLVDEVDRDALW